MASTAVNFVSDQGCQHSPSYRSKQQTYTKLLWCQADLLPVGDTQHTQCCLVIDLFRLTYCGYTNTVAMSHDSFKGLLHLLLLMQMRATVLCTAANAPSVMQPLQGTRPILHQHTMEKAQASDLIGLCWLSILALDPGVPKIHQPLRQGRQ